MLKLASQTEKTYNKYRIRPTSSTLASPPASSAPAPSPGQKAQVSEDKESNRTTEGHEKQREEEGSKDKAKEPGTNANTKPNDKVSESTAHDHSKAGSGSRRVKKPKKRSLLDGAEGSSKKTNSGEEKSGSTTSSGSHKVRSSKKYPTTELEDEKEDKPREKRYADNEGDGSKGVHESDSHRKKSSGSELRNKRQTEEGKKSGDKKENKESNPKAEERKEESKVTKKDHKKEKDSKQDEKKEGPTIKRKAKAKGHKDKALSECEKKVKAKGGSVRVTSKERMGLASLAFGDQPSDGEVKNESTVKTKISIRARSSSVDGGNWTEGTSTTINTTSSHGKSRGKKKHKKKHPGDDSLRDSEGMHFTNKSLDHRAKHQYSVLCVNVPRRNEA